MLNIARRTFGAALIVAASPLHAWAQPADKLTIALSATPSSVDPQFYVAGRDVQVAHQMFDGLTNQDERQRIVPGLALSWRVIDPLTWEFTLRPNVVFHDGTKFTGDAVATSIARVSTIKNSPSGFTPYVKDIDRVEVVSPTVVRIVTLRPTPLLPANLSKIAILPTADATLTTEDLNAGKGVIGTGPFRFKDWRPGDEVRLEGNPDWWGGKVAWSEVHLKVISDPAARVAALLSGDVDLIQDVPPQSQATVAKSEKVALISTPGNRLVLFQLDSGRTQSPQVTDLDGKPLAANPLQDKRVRKAFNLALNRQGIVERVMNGNGVAAGQLVPEGYPGYVPDLQPLKQDVNAAKALLTEAGYPNGFGLTIDGSSGQYPNDAQILQAVGQMLTRIGIKTKVEALAPAVFQPRAAKLEFSVAFQGAAIETGEASSMIRPVIATYDEARGYGTGNRGRYSNPELDRLLADALVEMDDAHRVALLQQAVRVAIDDSALLPVLFMNNTWGIRKGLEFTPRSDGLTLAAGGKPSR
jgi:peptide/nickel transport system substrate-binding protein